MMAAKWFTSSALVLTATPYFNNKVALRLRYIVFQLSVYTGSFIPELELGDVTGFSRVYRYNNRGDRG